MKITKTEFNEDDGGFILVWTDEDESIGFNFNLDSIKDKDDLKRQVRKRADAEKLKADKKLIQKEKYDLLKSVEGEEI